MAFPIGFEPTTYRLGGGRSILLSYGNIVFSPVPGGFFGRLIIAHPSTECNTRSALSLRHL